MTEASVNIPRAEDDRLALLLDLVQQINREPSLESVFALVADALRQIFHIDRFAVVLAEPDGENHEGFSLRLTASRGLSPAYLEAVQRRVYEGAGARALAERKPAYIPDATASPDFWPFEAAARAEGFRTVLIWPLFSGASPLGYLIMYHDQIRTYTAEEIMLAQGLAQQAALAVLNARLLAESAAHQTELERRFERRVAEAEAIDEIVLGISSSLELGATLQGIADAAARLSGAPYSSLYLLDTSQTYRAVAAHGVPLARLQQVVLRRDHGLISQMSRTGEPVEVIDFAHNVQSSPEAHGEVARLGARATLGVPLCQDGEVIGALYVAREEAERFPEDAARVLKRLASFAQVAIQNAQRFTNVEAERERTRSHLLQELLELSAVLNSNLSVAQVTERVVEAAMQLVGARGGAIGRIEEGRAVFRRYRAEDTWRDIAEVFVRGEGVPGHVWVTGRPYITNAAESDPHVRPRGYPFRRLVDVPLLDHEGVITGMLEVYDPVVDRDFGRMDVEILQLLAHQAAIAIENARLNQLKDDFLSIVSHELKTPITTIKGFTQVLQRRLSEESQRQAGHYLDVINHQADRLTTLINDLLDLSRIQTGRFVFDRVPFDYGFLVREVTTEMQLIVPNHRITLSAPEHVMVRGNADRLRQVLTNLIDNAAKHGPREGTIAVTVEVSGGEVTTYVCDEGHGLPAGEEDRIFRPYYQIARHGQLQIKGLGLGLFISREIIAEHGGRIWLDAVEHTSFCFALPLAQGTPDAPARPRGS